MKQETCALPAQHFEVFTVDDDDDDDDDDGDDDDDDDDECCWCSLVKGSSGPPAIACSLVVQVAPSFFSIACCVF